MLKRIDIAQLEVGMYLHHLDAPHSSLSNDTSGILIKDQSILEMVRSIGASGVFIDTEKGRNAASAKAKTPGASRPQRPATEEFKQSKALFQQATGIIKNMMNEVRLGKQVQISDLEPVTESLMQAVFRNHYAFTGISRLKNKDEYTFMHSVSVSGLLIAFGRDMGMSDDQLGELALGGLLHDIGKALVPNEILNKPGKLDASEFEIMKSHVTHSGEILKEMVGLGQIPIDITLLHHEKIDGTGYPLGLKDEEISAVGKMSAIADVYDALTSERVYKAAWEPTQTLKSMMEWSPTNLSRELLERFVRCLGIYPVGSTVRLSSGLIAVVIDQTEDLLRPQLRIAFNAAKNRRVPILDVDLTREMRQDRIEHIVDPQKFGINPVLLM